ncbi:hypothetical protein ACFX19_005792 [Malus domestica]
MKSVQLLENLIGALANVGAIAFSTLDMLPTVLDDLGDNVAGHVGKKDRISGASVLQRSSPDTFLGILGIP